MNPVGRFYTVGLLGIPVQLAALAVFARIMPADIATALAVETAIVHNYVWHARWTWRERRGSFWRFNATTGAISILANTALTKMIAATGIPLVAANAAAIAICSVVTYIAASRLAFRDASL